MVEVDQLAAEVRAEREKVQNMRRHPKLRSLVLMRLQVQRVKSIAGKLLKVSKSPVLSRDIVFECVCVCVCCALQPSAAMQLIGALSLGVSQERDAEHELLKGRLAMLQQQLKLQGENRQSS